MPSLQEIERFKKNLRAVGREEEVLAEKGETYRDLPPPSQGLSSDLSDLLEAEGEAPSDGPVGLFDDEAPSAPAKPAPAKPATSKPASAKPAPAKPERGRKGKAKAPPAEEAPEPAAPPATDDGGLGEFGALLDNLDGLIGEDSASGEGEALPQGFETAGDITGELGDMDFSLPTSEPTAEVPDFSATDFSAADLGATDLGAADALEGAIEGEGGLPLERIDFGEGSDAAASHESLQGAEPPAGDFDFSLPGGEDFTAPGGTADIGGTDDFGGAEAFDLTPGAADSFDLAPGAADTFDLAPGAADTFDISPGASDFSVPYGSAETPDAAEEPGSAAPPAEDFSVPSGPAPGEFDALGGFSFDDEPGGPAGTAEESFSLGAIDDELKLPEEFSIDSGAQQDFSLPGEAKRGAAVKRKPAAGRGPAARGAEEPEYDETEISLTERDLDRLQDGLLSFPRNLRLVVEELIAEDRLSQSQLKRLVRMIIDGAPIREVASVAGGYAGKRINVSRSADKRTGVQFEEERNSFSYAFFHNILPIAGIVLAAALAVYGLFVAARELVFVPLQANDLYTRGYASIEGNEYDRALKYFDQATRLRDWKDWYYRYAEAFDAKGAQSYADGMYGKLLGKWPYDKKAALDWAAAKERRFLFEDSAGILRKHLLEKYPLDREGLLALGDLYVTWSDFEARDYSLPAAAREEKALSHVEEARKAYASLMGSQGATDAYMVRMLRVFIRLDRPDQVDPVAARYLASKTHDMTAAVLDELADYAFARGRLAEVFPFLSWARELEPARPETHLLLARYYRAMKDWGEERKALNNALRSFGAVPKAQLKGKRYEDYVSLLIEDGEAWYRAGELLGAEDSLAKAAAAYEDGLARSLLVPGPALAKLYEDQGDIKYFVAQDFPAALELYVRARDNLGWNAALGYKAGWIHYAAGRYAEALGEFHAAAGDHVYTPSLELATANTLFLRGDYFAAEGFYATLSAEIEGMLARIPALDPEGQPLHANLLELRIKVLNNYGADLYRLAARTGDAALRTKAQRMFVDASQLFQNTNRDAVTMREPEKKDVAAYNLQMLLKGKGAEPVLALDIPREIDGIALPK